jgi:hypothetical protein
MDGPQMVGFAMFHGAHNFFLLGLPFLPFGALFTIGVLIFFAAICALPRVGAFGYDCL